MGGGTTSIAIFMEGKLVYVDTITVGGHHVTTDIAGFYQHRSMMQKGLKPLMDR